MKRKWNATREAERLWNNGLDERPEFLAALKRALSKAFEAGKSASTPPATPEDARATCPSANCVSEHGEHPAHPYAEPAPGDARARASAAAMASAKRNRPLPPDVLTGTPPGEGSR
jgi:hypothetical protein